MSPDPANNRIRLFLKSKAGNADIEITLINVNDRALRAFPGISPDFSRTITLPLDGVRPGIFFLAVRMGGSRFVQRFVKVYRWGIAAGKNPAAIIPIRKGYIEAGLAPAEPGNQPLPNLKTSACRI